MPMLSQATGDLAYMPGGLNIPMLALTPTDLPSASAFIMLGPAASPSMIGLVSGKISTLKLGEGFKDVTLSVSLLLACMWTAYYLGWL